jgi:hypothetical protein
VTARRRELETSGPSGDVRETGVGGPLAIGRIGALQRVSRPATYATGDPRGVLYALRLRIVNVGSRPASFADVQLQVVSIEGAVANAELLLELECLDPGDRLDGWLVFELPGGELPCRVDLRGPGPSGHMWQVDITDPIEDRHVYAGRAGARVPSRIPPPQ